MARKVIAVGVRYEGDEAQAGVEELIASIKDLKNSFENTSKEMQSGFKSAEKGADAASKGVKGFAGSIKNLVASLGIVALAVEAFNKLRELFMQNQQVADGFNTVMIAIDVVFTKLIEKALELGGTMSDTFTDPKQALIDFKDFIVERFFVVLQGLANQFVAIGDIIKSAFELDWDGVTKGAQDFGDAILQTFTATTKEERQGIIDAVKDFAKEVTTATSNALEYADALTKLRNEVKLLEAGQQEIQLTYQREAELQRQIRDDVRNTLAERIAANERLGQILEEQLEVELNVAQKRLELAELEAERNKNNIDLQAEVLRARGELADVEERIIGQRSEQLTNQAALEKELFDLRQQLRAEELEGRLREEEELQQHYDNLAEIARVAGEDIFEVEAARAKAINELRDKFRQEDLKKENEAAQKKLENEEKINQARITSASAVSGALGQISALMAQQGQENTAAAKALAIAQIAIDTATAISGAITTATRGSATPWDMIAGIAAGVGAVVSAIAQATTIINGVDVGGGTAATPSFNAPSAQAPTVNPVTTNTTELGNTEQAELQPIQAFVVETELTGTQENIGQIEGQAEFGLGG